MKFVDNLKAIYDNEHFELVNRSGTIIEGDKGATINEVNLNCDSEMLLLKKDLLDVTNRLFINKNDNPSVELAHGCDGVVITKNGDTRYLFFVELKSKFTSTSVKKAYDQFVASYIKLSLYFELIKGLDIKTFRIGAILISGYLDDETKTKLVKRMRLNDDKFCFERLCLKLNEGRVVVEKNKTLLERLPIKDKLVFEQLPMFYVATSKSNASINLIDYYPQII